MSVLFLLHGFQLKAQLLWEISGNGLQKSSWIFGTYHLATNQYLKEHPGVFNRFKKSGILITEANLFEQNLMNVFMQHCLLPDSIRISDSLSAHELKILDSLISENPPLFIDDKKPAYIANIVTTKMLQKQSSDADSGDSEKLEMALMRQSVNDGKESLFLESAEFQIGLLLDSLTLHEQFEMLRGLIRMPEDSLISAKYRAQLQLPELWEEQNLDAMYALFRDDIYFREMEDYLVIQRNIKWTKILTDWLTKGTCFIAVGAMHLPGKSGLIELLRTAGFQVRPVKYR
ncbi:MAG: TraB/GumN family protein [Bacteroidia bacterium]|nr:TraB/GumN family protein [Bacteroidia bacterium]